MDRQQLTPSDVVADIWHALDLPSEALNSLHLIDDADCLPSSFKVAHLAQAAIASSALAAATYYSLRHHTAIPNVTVPMEHACVEFKSERLYTLNGKPPSSPWGPIGGFHRTKDGYVRVHDNFPTHQSNALEILGLGEDASRDDVAAKMLEWKSVDLETEAFRRGAVIVALRSFEEWDAHPQSSAISNSPISLWRLMDTKPYIQSGLDDTHGDKCLRGIRVVEMSRVIAAPVAGKTLAAHGAEVLWITSPTLPDQPALDRDLARGKRTVRLDIKQPSDKEQLLELLRTADVFIQSFRPGSLAAQGLSKEELTKLNPNLIVASLSSYGPEGPWSQNRGFDSLVQTCSGINVADAERYGAGDPLRVLPCQALDHGAGYLLATGVIAALCKRGTEGGAFDVHVSLAGVGKYLRSLGQYPDKTGFDRKDFANSEDVERYLETRDTWFGELRAVDHSAAVEGMEIGWDVMPKPLGSDVAVWP
jgi:hypothetical protein